MLIAVIIAGLVIIAIAVFLLSSRPWQSGVSEAPDEEVFRLHPGIAEFHVKGEDALVTFEVPIPPGDPDPVLRDLLSHEAVEVVREKRHDLPIAQVHRVVVFGKRGGEAVEVSRVELETPGELPAPLSPDLIPHASRLNFDPLAAVADAGPSAAPGVAEVTPESGLAPVGSELTLTGTASAGLRAQGLDPATAGAGDLGIGILRLSGYTVAPGPSPDTYTATRAGTQTFVKVSPLEPGGYPELNDREINQFVIDFNSSGAAQGLLFSDKFCPFEVYERERREPRIRFVTRERLQRFVDAFAIG
jgi:hypothetical protein